MSDGEWVDSGGHTENGNVAFDYIKTSDFRTVWVDGAIGSITPAGLIHFAVYSERPSIPRRQVFSVLPDGGQGQKLGTELMEKRISRDAIVREMPIDMILSLSVAESLAQWLLQQVEVLRSATAVEK